jgi:hypothetical protein
MVQVQCEKTGIIFEAPSKRTKNHPTIMSIIDQSYKGGWYSQANETLKQGRTEGWTTIEQFVTALNQAEEQYKAERKEQIHAETERKYEQKEARRQRRITNDVLRGYGYCWEKYENDEEDQDFFNAPAVEWTLYSPDRRVVSVQEAMQELATQDVKFAKDWLAERNIAEIVPVVEQQQEDIQVTEQQPEQQEDTYLQEFTQELLKNGFTPEEAHQHAVRMSKPHDPSDEVQLTESVRLSEDDTVEITLDSGLLYGVRIGDRWRGIDYCLHLYDFLHQHHDQLVEFSKRNQKRNQERRERE